MLDLVKVARVDDLDAEDLLLALNIVHALLKETSATFFTVSERQDGDATVEHCGMQIADSFYAAPDNKSARVPTTGFAGRLLANAFTGLLELVLSLSANESASAELLLAAMNLLSFLADQLAKDQPVRLSWHPQEWQLKLVHAVSDGHLAFDNVEAAVQCLLSLNAAPLEPPLSLDRRSTIAAIIDSVS
jgi:hypothetical protein